MAQNYEAKSENTETDSLSLRDFMTAIRLRSRIVWTTIFLAGVLGCLYMMIAKPQYTITMIVAPSPAGTSKISTSGSVSSALSSLTGGSSSALSGILGSTGAPASLPPMDEFMQLIISPRIAQKLIDHDPKILQTIFVNQWDPAKKQWHPPYGPVSVIERLFYGLFGLPGWSPPSAQTLSAYLTQYLTVTEVNTTAMQQITLNLPSPTFGVSFFKQLHDTGDAVVRLEAQDLADSQIDYIQKKLATTQELDYRQMLLSLLANQVINRMSINSSVPYAAALVQTPISTDLPTSPNPFVVMTVAIVLGFLMGIFAALMIAIIWPQGLQRKTSYGSGHFLPAFHKTLEYFLTVPENVRSNAN